MNTSSNLFPNSNFNEVQLLAKSSDIDGDSNFPQGCQISPDLSCVLTCTAADKMLRLYNTPSCDSSSSCQTIDEDTTSTTGANNKPAISSWKTALRAQEADSVRSYCWYPLMNSHYPSSCAFIASSRDQPIHLIDAYTSLIRASYRPYNGLDEMESPSVITFTPDGSRIFASGFRSDRMIQVFDTAIPGRDATILKLGKTRRSSDGQKGMVSALSFPEGSSHFFGNNKVFAVGTYSPGSIYIYDDRRPSGDPAATVLHGGICVVGHGKSFTKKKRRFAEISIDEREIESKEGYSEETIGKHEVEEESSNRYHDDNDDVGDIFSMAKVNWYQSRARGGITQLQWSKGGTTEQSDFYVYSASRRSDAVIAWDMRVLTGNDSYPIRGIAAYPRDGDTNQRLEFDLSDDGKFLFTASQNKTVKIYDVKKGGLIKSIDGFDDVTNGISYKSHEDLGNLLAVSTGARRFMDDNNDEEMLDDNVGYGNIQEIPGSLSMYKF